MFNSSIPEGQRRERLFKYACSLRSRYVSMEVEEAKAFVTGLWTQVEDGRHPFPLEDAHAQVEDVWERYPAGRSEEDGPAGAYGSDEREYQWNAYGVGRRLVDRHRDKIRYCYSWGSWVVWNGRCWAPDDSGEMLRLTAETVSSMYAELSKFDPIKDKAQRDAYFKHISRSQSVAARQAAIDSASADDRVIIHADKLDADRMLLTVLNGTLDLRTGDLRPHRQEDLITKVAPVEWSEDATDEVWNKFIKKATGGDEELENFLQDATFATLTGDTSDKSVIFLHGPPDGGKSTFLKAVRSVLGVYAMNMAFETLIRRQYAGGIRSDIARLEGARMVYAIETEASDQLDAGLLKWLVGGGDEITAALKYKNERSFVPQFTLWLAANEMPRMKVEDEAAWGRLKLVPFLRVPEERDPAIMAHLASSGRARSAILAWAMRGRERWLEKGLVAPRKVVEDTAEVRAGMNPLKDWVEACCYPVPTPGAWTSTERLRKSYERWCRSRSVKPVSRANFAGGLRGLGCLPERGYEDQLINGEKVSAQERGWAGIALTAAEAERGASGIVEEEEPS